MVLSGQTRARRLWTGESRGGGVRRGGVEQVPTVQIRDRGALGGARAGRAETKLDLAEAVDALAHLGLVRVSGGHGGDAGFVPLQHGCDRLEVVALSGGIGKAADLVGVDRAHGGIGFDDVKKEALEGVVAKEGSSVVGDTGGEEDAVERGEGTG